MNPKPVIGIIGGTGLANLFDHGKYDIIPFDTLHFGMVDMYVGEIAGETVYFVPRHGRFHDRLPSEVNYLGNLVALKMNGVTDVIGVSAMGNLIGWGKPLLQGCLAFPTEIVDKTHGRSNTIFGKGIVGHVDGPWAVCRHLYEVVFSWVVRGNGFNYLGAGVLGVINGPRFNSRPESQILRNEGCKFVGMTSAPEAGIARELGLCYMIIGQVTDNDNCDDSHVDQSKISDRISACGESAKRLIELAVPAIVSANHIGECDCASAIHGSILTNRAGISHEAKRRIRDIFRLEGDIPAHWFTAH